MSEPDRDQILADFLEEDVDTIFELSHQPNTFTVGDRREYRVLTDDEADKATYDEIKECVWAFVPSFLVNYLPDGITEDVIVLIQEKCEDANEPILSMIGDRFDEFVEDAISCDGRGHFLSGYDGNENEADEGDFYIYRTN